MPIGPGSSRARANGRPASGTGLRRFFAWLEGRSYKMHVRVLLSRYRAYDVCTACDGARLTDESLDWRVGDKALADQVLPPEQRFRHGRIGMDETTWQASPGSASTT
jgi:excinuclease ABC subunit A